MDQQPLLDDEESYIWAGFLILHRARQAGYGTPQPIPVSEMIEYGREFLPDVEEFVEVISLVDVAYRKLSRGKGEDA